MSKTYTLAATSVKGGKRVNWTSQVWNGLSLRENTGEVCQIGGTGSESTPMYATYIMFDPADLAVLRAKTIESITLSIIVESGIIPKSGNQNLPIGYKLTGAEGTNVASDAWTRSDAASTQSQSLAIGFLRVSDGGEVTANNTPLTIDLTGTSVPVYGYTIGPNIATYNRRVIISSSATLSIVTSEVETHTVTYNANGGVDEPGPQTKHVDTPLTLSSGTPTRAGYYFTKWNTAADGTGTDYNPGDSYIMEEDATLYAQWEQITGSGVRVKGSDGTMHQGTVYVKGSDGTMHQATVYVKGSDGTMHQSS